jgi:hypothetical protein
MVHRRFFDKVVKDGNASFSGTRDGQKFLSAIVEYEDKVDLLYCLMSPKVCACDIGVGTEAINWEITMDGWRCKGLYFQQKMTPFFAWDLHGHVAHVESCPKHPSPLKSTHT